MKKFILIFILLTILVFLSGCSGTQNITLRSLGVSEEAYAEFSSSNDLSEFDLVPGTVFHSDSSDSLINKYEVRCFGSSNEVLFVKEDTLSHTLLSVVIGDMETGKTEKGDPKSVFSDVYIRDHHIIGGRNILRQEAKAYWHSSYEHEYRIVSEFPAEKIRIECVLTGTSDGFYVNGIRNDEKTGSEEMFEFKSRYLKRQIISQGEELCAVYYLTNDKNDTLKDEAGSYMLRVNNPILNDDIFILCCDYLEESEIKVPLYLNGQKIKYGKVIRYSNGKKTGVNEINAYELRELLSDFDSDSIMRTGSQKADKLDIGTILYEIRLNRKQKLVTGTLGEYFISGEEARNMTGVLDIDFFVRHVIE